MPDISMCKDKECKSKDYCYRYTATPDGWQSYFADVGKPTHTLLLKKTARSKALTRIPCCSYFYANDTCIYHSLEKIEVPNNKPLTISELRRP
jgi:hypothetical protein